MSLLDVAGTAQRLLDLVVALAAAEGIELPGRQYVTGASGNEAWDCEQVVVGITGLTPGNAGRAATLLGQPTNTPPGGPMLVAAVLRVEIVRAVPVFDDEGEPPPVTDMNDAGVAALRDAALLNAVRVKATSEATLTSGESGDVLPGNITPAGPEGGFAGMSLTITVTALNLES